jgi:hypothetical protein
MTNIAKNYLGVLEVISSLNCEIDYKSGVRRKFKISDLENTIIVWIELITCQISYGNIVKKCTSKIRIRNINNLCSRHPKKQKTNNQEEVFFYNVII